MAYFFSSPPAQQLKKGFLTDEELSVIFSWNQLSLINIIILKIFSLKFHNLYDHDQKQFLVIMDCKIKKATPCENSIYI